MWFILLFICLILIDFYYNKISFISIYKNLGITIIFFLTVYYLRNPTELLAPYNEIIENFHEKKVFYSDEEKKKIFPTSQILEKRWKDIQNECINVLTDEFRNGNVENVENVGRQFIIENENFWKGWKTFPLKLFNRNNEKNMKKCPIISEIINSDSNITTAFFSIMEPGKILPSHYGPFKGILRYHLGLVIPPKDSGDCFISVDNEIYEWKEGEGILFDETYKHFVKNETPYLRVILFLDIKRPLNFLNPINELILYVMSISPYNLN